MARSQSAAPGVTPSCGTLPLPAAMADWHAETSTALHASELQSATRASYGEEPSSSGHAISITEAVQARMHEVGRMEQPRRELISVLLPIPVPPTTTTLKGVAAERGRCSTTRSGCARDRAAAGANRRHSASTCSGAACSSARESEVHSSRLSEQSAAPSSRTLRRRASSITKRLSGALHEASEAECCPA